MSHWYQPILLLVLLGFFHVVNGVHEGQICGKWPNQGRRMKINDILVCQKCDPHEYWNIDDIKCMECIGLLTNLSPNIRTSCKEKRIGTERHQVKKIGTTSPVKIDTDELSIPSTTANTTTVRHTSTIYVLETEPTTPKKPTNKGKELEKLDEDQTHGGQLIKEGKKVEEIPEMPTTKTENRDGQFETTNSGSKLASGIVIFYMIVVLLLIGW